jgi:biotin carboxylase
VWPDLRVLVVGTTTDYIHWIRQSCADRALFLTDAQLRGSAAEPPPRPEEEILCDLSEYDRARSALDEHLIKFHQRLDGVACFDCESMELASILAGHFSLPYPSVEAIGHCRNKYITKRLWQSCHLETPPVTLVRSVEDAVRFQQSLQGPIVLKPLSGSGSELIFTCADPEACEAGYQRIRNGLRQRRNHRLYADFSPDDPDILAEGLIRGDEYSCDFIVQNGCADVIRLTRKIPAPAHAPFGTTLGYVLTSALPEGPDTRNLHRTLVQSAAALGIQRGVCMLDFIIDRGRAVLLELAPRPGGDCLPFLLRQACGLDMLKLLLDFACHKPLSRMPGVNGKSLVGLRVHARQSGILQHIDSRDLAADQRVRNIHLIREQGHNIILPPDDYDAWFLGHVIFEPDGRAKIEDQCNALLEKLRIVVE